MMGNDLGYIHIQGIDAKRFLQGQLTINIDLLANQASALAALCNPQGRIISLFNIVLYNNDYYIILPKEMITKTCQTLQKYAVFFKTTIQQPSTLPFNYQPLSNIESIQAGIPAIYTATSESFLPHELNLPQLQAVSFDKGCFTGQEIIARMQYRGKLKKHLYQAVIKYHPDIHPGTELFASPPSKDANPAATVIDIAKENSHCRILLVCEDEYARNGEFYLPDNTIIDVDFDAAREVT